MCPEQDGRLMTEPMRRTDELTMSGHRIPFVYNDTPEMGKKKNNPTAMLLYRPISTKICKL